MARLNGTNVNLDDLKDDELNKLYSSILKVRHSRTSSSATSGDRPESRMSLMESVTEDSDDDERVDESRRQSQGSPLSRPFSSDTWSTQATSLADSTITLSHAPDEEDEEARAADALEKRNMEDKLRVLETQLLAQKQRYEKRVRRLTRGTPLDELDDFDFSPPLTDDQERLARWTVARWKTRRRVAMAEEVMSQAVAVKEANVLSREMQKGVTLQLALLDRDPPVSTREMIAGMGDIEGPTDLGLVQSAKPCVGVKVLDRRHRAVYTWSLPKLHQRLLQMRNMHKWVDKPEYNQHFAWQDPFFETPPPPDGFSHVGSAMISLAPLSRNVPSTSVLPIYSPYTADPLGTMRVRIKPLSITSPEAPGVPLNQGLEPSMSPFVTGSVLTFEITVDKVCGLNKADFLAIHLQTRRSSFRGSLDSTDDDDSIVSGVVELDTASCSELKLKHAVSIELSSSVQEHLAKSYSSIDLFGRVTLAHLDKIERWDEARDSSSTSKIANVMPVRGDPLNGDVTRRPENELVSEQRHDVVASVEIHELGEAGEYAPVQVVSSNPLDSGAFFLRQGLQRRLVLNLTHNSGRGWMWERVSKVSLGNVRMLDGRGRVHAATSAADVQLRGMGKPRATFNADGIAAVSFAAAWDSSVHDSPHLNRNTAPNSRALIRLDFEVIADNCTKPIPFSMDIAVTVQSRDARGPSKLSTLFSSSRLASRVTGVFAVRLVPALTRKSTDIWRLNTAEVYVRGEELLANWKPRGLSLLRDFDQVRLEQKRAADVQAAKAMLSAFELTLPNVAPDISAEQRLSSVIELWRKRFGPAEEVSPVDRLLRAS